jgi:Polyketide cyclase / dehydrase and lipid transport
MTRWWLAVAGALALTSVVCLALATQRPDRLYVRRSIAIAAPPEKIFPLLNDFHNWGRWAPQDQEDPGLVRTYAGPAAGRGALSQWHGAGSGAGRMQITHSTAAEHVEVSVDFVRPFATHNINDFTLIPRGAFTQLTWDLTAQTTYTMKVMGLFVDMNAKMGEHLDKGLGALKTLAEQ